MENGKWKRGRLGDCSRILPPLRQSCFGEGEGNASWPHWERHVLVGGMWRNMLGFLDLLSTDQRL